MVGTPAAYLIARRRFRGRSVVITLIELPLVLPPAAAGIALLAAFGPNGLVGGAIEDAGIRLVLETAGVVVALTFVAAPFYVRGAIAAFEAIDSSLLDASRTLGAGEGRTFARVAIPVARAGLGSGLALAWGRALGEFGATLMFAGSLAGPDADRAAGDLRVPLPRLRRRRWRSRRCSRLSAFILLSVKLLGGRPEGADAARLSSRCDAATSTSTSSSRWRGRVRRARRALRCGQEHAAAADRRA